MLNLLTVDLAGQAKDSQFILVEGGGTVGISSNRKRTH